MGVQVCGFGEQVAACGSPGDGKWATGDKPWELRLWTTLHAQGWPDRWPSMGQGQGDRLWELVTLKTAGLMSALSAAVPTFFFYGLPCA